VINSLDEWRDELRDIYAELISLLCRRMQLAFVLLRLLRDKELTLGDLDDDIDRLGIFLYAEIGEPIPPPLDRRSLEEIFRRIIIEEKRLAWSLSEDSGRGVG
jgi:hypothetical protein